MKLRDLRPLYTRPGPYATAYVDAGMESEDAAHEIQLRAREAYDSLQGQGAEQGDAEAVRTAIVDGPKSHGRYGLAVFATNGEVVRADILPQRPADSWATWARLPHVMPALVARGEQVPHVLVLVDRIGADLAAFPDRPTDPHRDNPQNEEQLTGSDHPINKVRGGGMAHARYQRRAENTWDANADAVAGEVVELAEQMHAQVVLVAGDVRAVGLLQERLPERWRTRVRVLDTGGRAGGVDPELLEEARRAAVAEQAAVERQAVEQRFTERAGRADGTAVEGFAPTVHALREGRVDTLLLSDRPHSEEQLWIGPEPEQLALFPEDLRTIGVPEPESVRADSAMARALAGTAAELLVVTSEDDTEPAEGVGALLRYG